MRRYEALFIYGLLMVITGVSVSLAGANPLSNLQYIVAIGMFLSSIPAFYTAYACRNYQVPMSYHALHGIGMVLIGFVVLFFCTNMERFYLIMISFYYYYGITEIIFCLQLLLLKDVVNIKTLAIRGLIGFLVIIGAIAVTNVSDADPRMAITITGIILVFIGVNVVLYRTVLKKLEKTF